ncbi:hypothetical protein [Stenotrophomonas rhizophila]|uniref:hypothetical protein n=1 Tax=Stenotrophomonas rhizophila TaxID=216778 RepID=UPI0028A868CD|nr:hypothetical protein [Stenotrophomonas rhizophila]
METSELKNILVDLDEMVVTIDKIGSGFEDKETTALALLLFFRKREILDKLAEARKLLGHHLSEAIGAKEYYKRVETDMTYWKPPYGKNKNEIAALLDSLDN